MSSIAGEIPSIDWQYDPITITAFSTPQSLLAFIARIAIAANDDTLYKMYKIVNSEIDSRLGQAADEAAAFAERVPNFEIGGSE